MKGFLYFLGGICVFTEISMYARASSGLEQFSPTYIISMLIIGIVAFLFFSKAENISNYIEEIQYSKTTLEPTGDLILKYKILIDYLKSVSKGRIISAEGNTLKIRDFNKGLSMIFILDLSYGAVKVTWQIICPSIGNQKHSWVFYDKKLSQILIAETIEKDIILKSQPYLNSFGINLGDILKLEENVEQYSLKKENQIELQNTLTEEEAIQILNSRSLITKPGKFQVKVTNVSPFEREDGTFVMIVSYAAMTQSQLNKAVELFKKSDYQEATNQKLSSTQRIGKDFMPSNGELVNVVVDYVPSKEGLIDKALLVINCSAIHVETAQKVTIKTENKISPQKQETGFYEESRNLVVPSIVNGFRKLAKENNSPPTSKTSDDEIIDIYHIVGAAFNEASEKRNEIISDGNLNTIVLKFIIVYEQFGKDFFADHLIYEIEKYLREGLRDDYKNDLILFEKKGIKNKPISEELLLDNKVELKKSELDSINLVGGNGEKKLTWEIDNSFKIDKSLLHETPHQLLATHILKPFGLLSFKEQAQVLSIFFQKNHNNIFIDNLLKEYSFLLNKGYSFCFDNEINFHDYGDGAEFFFALLSSDIENEKLIMKCLSTIQNNQPEFFRICAILSSINHDGASKYSYISLASQAWHNIKKSDEFLYGFLLKKTAADLLIYEKKYLEAQKICEECWEYLDVLETRKEKSIWLKYQFAKTLIKISTYCQVDFDTAGLIEEAKQFRINAELENCLNTYLINTFPKSNLSSQFGEIECEFHFTISIVTNKVIKGYTFSNEIGFIIGIFDLIFNLEDECIWVLINEWDIFGDGYTIDQFNGASDQFGYWISSDEGTSRKQLFFIKKKCEINYRNLFFALLTNEINSRIFFIDPTENIVFIFWDNSVYVGSKDLKKIKPIYEKYYSFINEYSRLEFEKQIS